MYLDKLIYCLVNPSVSENMKRSHGEVVNYMENYIIIYN